MWFKTADIRKTPAQELFIERCLQLVKPGGRIAIILPETYGHAPTKGYIRQYMREHAFIRAVIDLPHNTFRPHCNAKTLLWILEKRETPGTGKSENVVFGIAEEMGRDHHGKVKYRINQGLVSDDVWNDMPAIREEWSDPNSRRNKRVLVREGSTLREDIYVPRHYWQANESAIAAEADERGCYLVKMQALIDEGILEVFRGHGAPPNQYKGTGPIPYVRVGDIGNWIVYKNPTAGIPRNVYQARRKKKILKSKDLVFVHDGSYRIGDVGIVLPSDTEILLDSHCLVMRIVRPENRYGIDGLYLAYLLRHDLTQRQLPSRIFINTTLPDIGNRWLTLMLPVSRSASERQRVTEMMRGIYQRRFEAERMIGDLMNEQASTPGR